MVRFTHLLVLLLVSTLQYSDALQVPSTGPSGEKISNCEDLSPEAGEWKECDDLSGTGSEGSSLRSESGREKAMANVLVLDGVWQIRNRLNTMILNGSVPGNIYTALETAGLIDDPYYGSNDVTYRWVANDHWTYSRTFDASQLNVEHSSVLSCYGLDTVSIISLNGVEIGRTDNQFIQYDFNITGILQPGTNEIEVEFTSAVEYAEQKSSEHEYAVPPACPPAEYHPECHANFIRKAQCSFAWDWGPAFPTQGIWKTIQIETFTMATLRSFTTQTRKDDNGNWFLRVTVQFDVASPQTAIEGFLTHVIPDLTTAARSWFKLAPGVTTLSYELEIKNVEEWWPRGYGAQTLYRFTLMFEPNQTNGVDSKIVKRIAFRTVEVVEDPISAGENSGSSFYFKINGVPIFMKGSNWIPMDSFVERVTYERLRYLMEAAVEVNMNTIRIWGGGIYESDDFYDIADELGILVWQDMMFACSMYPVDDAFLTSVRAEIRYQVRRLSNHPSLVAWTANNENEGALVDNWYGTAGALYPTYKEDYVKLYIDTVRDEILANDWTRAFLSSSPTNGHVTEDNGWISESPRPGQPQYGDVHFYNYAADCLDYTIYPRTRYASEYGYQSWPSYETMLKVAEPDQLYHGSEFFNHREHHHEALEGTETQIRNHFTWPDSGDQQQDFKSYIFLTQAAQAVCYQSQTEFYRRSRSVADTQTMGALYWQHNDIWQAPSWSTIDYEGQWKMAHYFAARFFADPMLSVIREGSNFSIYSVNDRLSSFEDVTLVMEVWDWNGSSRLHRHSLNVIIEAEGSFKLFEQSYSELLTEAGCSSLEACFIICWAENSTETKLTYSSTFYPVSWKDVTGMIDPQLTIDSVTLVDLMTFDVTISSRSVSVFTWLTTGDILGRFSDNGFLMTPQTLQLKFYARLPDVTPENLLNSLTITSLWSQYSTATVEK